MLVFTGQRWNSWIRWRLTYAKAFTKEVFFNQERKLGNRRRSDTVVASTINDAVSGWVNVAFRLHSHCMRNQRFWVPGGVWSQGWNLKELTEGHTRSGACGLIWLNTGKLTRSRHSKDWQIEDLSWFYGWCAWPFLVGGVICLVNSVNERDLDLLNSSANSSGFVP